MSLLYRFAFDSTSGNALVRKAHIQNKLNKNKHNHDLAELNTTKKTNWALEKLILLH